MSRVFVEVGRRRGLGAEKPRSGIEEQRKGPGGRRRRKRGAGGRSRCVRWPRRALFGCAALSSSLQVWSSSSHVMSHHCSLALACARLRSCATGPRPPPELRSHGSGTMHEVRCAVRRDVPGSLGKRVNGVMLPQTMSSVALAVWRCGVEERQRTRAIVGMPLQCGRP